jgi:hypothetical protein
VGGSEPAIFPAIDHAGKHPRRPPFLVDIFRLQELLQQADLIVGIEHGEGGLQIHELGMAAENLDSDGMEGAEPGHAFDRAADQLAHARLHLPRRLVGEGDGEDLRWPCPAEP